MMALTVGPCRNHIFIALHQGHQPLSHQYKPRNNGVCNYMYVYVYVCMHACMHVRMYASTHVRMYVSTLCIVMCVCMHMYI